MINKKKFAEIRKEMKEFEKKREETIQLSRTIIKLSKRIIYSVHRREMNTAKRLVAQILAGMKKMPSKKYDLGIDAVAAQEFVEALCFYHYVNDKKLPTRKDLKVNSESYLLGLCDLTGEMVRLAVNESIRGNSKATFEIKDFVTEIYGEFLKFDLRNGELRKKSDSIKWNLRKLEDLALKISNV
ncbi:MAG: hypothetical protein U9Q69_00435 [Nanoarchaeota archaeon]|nr:hypothetical protein [Nanoarchaeota archaeon]